MSALDEFLRTETLVNSIRSEELRYELSLDFDNFNQPKLTQHTEALSRLILNLLLMEPGTYPDTPELGINIASYQFEFMTQETISKIQNKINKQIDQYIPSNNIQKTLVMKNINKHTGKVELIIGFSIAYLTSDGLPADQNLFIRIANDEINGLRTQIIE